jgi:hypothetical protein
MKYIPLPTQRQPAQGSSAPPTWDASFTVPPLSTVRIDVDAIGRELIHLLYSKLDSDE